ncbi:hypothetical protein Y1Q_0010948 [Alligator mississippiensis]|uniref:Uncharacterized protein n=1 Tax=Alligator mississippiensis TaxID=8496 RepID=A0A151MEH0_ALLMI|nr:hypothetical protein Y1Q_0010948 [Alligator mississippiensis]
MGFLASTCPTTCCNLIPRWREKKAREAARCLLYPNAGVCVSLPICTALQASKEQKQLHEEDVRASPFWHHIFWTPALQRWVLAAQFFSVLSSTACAVLWFCSRLYAGLPPRGEQLYPHSTSTSNIQISVSSQTWP